MRAVASRPRASAFAVVVTACPTTPAARRHERGSGRAQLSHPIKRGQRGLVCLSVLSVVVLVGQQLLAPTTTSCCQLPRRTDRQRRSLRLISPRSSSFPSW
jgi:hypothetical protein